MCIAIINKKKNSPQTTHVSIRTRLPVKDQVRQ